MATSTILSVVYDLPTVSSPDDPTVTKVNAFMDKLLHYALPGNYLVEFFTWMKCIPSSIAKWKKEAEEGHKEYSKLFMDLFRDVENRVVTSFVRSSSSPDSFVGTETGRRTTEFCWDLDSRIGTPSSESHRGRVVGRFNVVRDPFRKFADIRLSHPSVLQGLRL